MALLILCLTLPLALFYLRRHPRKVLYRGQALALTGVKYIDSRGRYAWIMLSVPDVGVVQAYIPVSRARMLPEEAGVVAVDVVICQGTLGEPWVESMKWCDNEVEHRATTALDDSLFLMSCYILLALLAALLGYESGALILFGGGLLTLTASFLLRKPISDVSCSCGHAHEDETH